MRYPEAFAESVWGADAAVCDSSPPQTRVLWHFRAWNVIVERFGPLWNAVCWLQDEDYPLTGDRMHTRWCLGIWWEVRALIGIVPR